MFSWHQGKEYLVDFGLMVFASFFSRKRRAGGMMIILAPIGNSDHHKNDVLCMARVR
jgi:hypothetical protein